MTVKLGTNPIAWSNDDLPELGGDTPLETCLRETREAGFTGTEMGNKFPKQPEPLKAKLGEYGLEFVSGWYSAELRTRTVEEEIRAMQSHLDLLAACGCKVMVFAETSGTVQGRRDVPVSDRPTMSEDEWPGYLERITKLSEYMAGKGGRTRDRPRPASGTAERAARALRRPRRPSAHSGWTACSWARPTPSVCSSTPATSPSRATTRLPFPGSGRSGSTTSTPRTSARM